MRDPDVGQLIQQIVAGTVRNILAGFIIERQSRGLSKNTIRFYLGELNLFCEYLGSVGVVNLHEITPDVIRIYILQLGTTRNAGGCHAAYRATRAFLLWYEDEFEPEGWRNPIRKVHPPKVTKQALPGVPVGDIQKMVAACTTSMGKRDKAILLCLFDTGARASECVALNIKDVDFITGPVKIAHGKGDKSRTVFLGSKSRRALRTYIKTRGELQPNSPLFVTDEGERLEYWELVKIIRRRAADAGIEQPSPHDFRRAFAISMLRNGCDLARLAELMGHSSLEVLRLYLYLLEDDLREVHRQASPVDNW